MDQRGRASIEKHEHTFSKLHHGISDALRLIQLIICDWLSSRYVQRLHNETFCKNAHHKTTGDETNCTKTAGLSESCFQMFEYLLFKLSR